MRVWSLGQGDSPGGGKGYCDYIREWVYSFLNLFYWSVVDLQYINFWQSLCCTAEINTLYIVNQIYIYIYLLFHTLFYYGLSQDIEYYSLTQ